MRVLFWNVQKKPLEDSAATLVASLKVDVVVLVEATQINATRQVTALTKATGAVFCYHPFPTDSPNNSEFQFFSRYPPKCFSPLGHLGHMAAMGVKLPITKSLTFIAVHSQSRIYWSQPSDRFALAGRIRKYLDQTEKKTGHDRTCLLGDFNSDPFDPALTNSDTLNATMCSRVASKGSRRVASEDHKFLYNPMWSLMGDVSSGPPGTMHYNNATSSSNYWYLFDQVLLRPSLINCFDKSKLTIVEQVHGLQLAGANGGPDSSMASDHFPVIFELNTDSEDLCDVN